MLSGDKRKMSLKNRLSAPLFKIKQWTLKISTNNELWMIGISQKLPQWCNVPPNSSAPHLACFFSSVSFNTSFVSPTPPNFFATGQIVEPTFCAYVIPSSLLSHAVSFAQLAFDIEMSPIFFFDEMKKCPHGPLQYEFTWHLHVTWLSARAHCWNWDHNQITTSQVITHIIVFAENLRTPYIKSSWWGK